MNGFYTENKINYQYCAKIIDLGKRPIDTIDDYVSWVRDWKELHRELIEAIHYFRAQKDQAKLVGDSTKGNRAWLNKKALGRYARMMYELRSDRKEAVKAGKYKELEAA